MTDSTPTTTLPPDFLSGSANISLNRIDFSKTRLPEYKEYYAVVLDNVLSPDECKLLVKAAEAQANGTWAPAMVNAGLDRQVVSLMVRNSGRIIWDSADVAARIWARVAGSLPELQVLEGWANVMGNGPVKRGERWRVTRLNERMRFLKYGAGQYFREHADGAYIAPNGERSFFTLHLYLNDSSSDSADGQLQGGATTFWSANMVERLDVTPKNGRVLVFQQRNLLHSGEEVTSGVKLTMRTDMMFEKPGFSLPQFSVIGVTLAPLALAPRLTYRALFYPATRAVPALAPPTSRAAVSRLSLISRHLHNRPVLELNTPFSTERLSAAAEDHIEHVAPSESIDRRRHNSNSSTKTEERNSKMSNQADHPTLLIPGPIEFDDEVLKSMSHYSESHVGQAFVNVFGETLTMLRKLFQTTRPDTQPFVVNGSGTLGWDMVAANLAEHGDEVLVLHTGYFADSFADCFETYGLKATQLKAPIGDRPQLDEVEKALKEKKYKIITVTHVDTSTGVLSEVQALSEMVHKVSPETLVVVDGVCSVGSEEIHFDDWALDVVLTASQKGVGCPAGLSIMMCSGRAIEVFKNRKTPPRSYFASFKNWLPIMQNYEAKKASYFATPSPQLIHALHTSLTQILSRPLSDRFAAHRAASHKIKQAIADLGLAQVATKPENQANGMTAFYLPDDIKAAELLPRLVKKGVVFAAGLHREIAGKYMRIGHMGVSVMDPARGDLDRAVGMLTEGLGELGYQKAK